MNYIVQYRDRYSCVSYMVFKTIEDANKYIKLGLGEKDILLGVFSKIDIDANTHIH